MSLFDAEGEDGEKLPALIEPEVVEVRAHKKGRKPKASYDELFAALPAVQVEIDTLTDGQKACPLCGTQMVPIGHEVIRTKIRYTEPKLERIEYVSTTYGCPPCKDTEEPQFIKDEGSPALIPGSYASSGLAAHVMFVVVKSKAPSDKLAPTPPDDRSGSLVEGTVMQIAVRFSIWLSVIFWIFLLDRANISKT